MYIYCKLIFAKAGIEQFSKKFALFILEQML